MQLHFFNNLDQKTFYPLTLTRGVADLRVGVLTIAEKWQKFFDKELYEHSPNPTTPNTKGISDNILGINPTFLPTRDLIQQIKALQTGDCIVYKDVVVAYLSDSLSNDFLNIDECSEMNMVSMESEPLVLVHLSDLFKHNGEQIIQDIQLLEAERSTVPEHCTVIGNKADVYVHPSASVLASTLNVEKGPIYIGKGATVMESSMVRGPFALCEHATLKMGTKVYEDTTIGPWCKAGGEIGNSIMIGYSNKGHDGYMGNSILGEWCNLGADTNTSNLKNNYSEVKIWSYESEQLEKSGLTFCGLIMGDHSKCGINTMFNTGTVVGVSANIYGGNFPPKFIPSFSWGGSDGMVTYDIEKAIDTAERVMARRKVELDDKGRELLRKIHRDSKKYRQED
ncbi:MAG: GlmU family protein [Bacteroidota bacterium]